jgi:ligand-binding sensor domain-containing protein
LCRTNEGFLWFGTRLGLYRHDGYAFKVFVRDAGNPNSLDGIVVRALFKDRDSAMETFTRYPIPLASHITQDTAGLLWVTTLGGLYRLDPASGEIQHYSHDPNDGARSSCYKASAF